MKIISGITQSICNFFSGATPVAANQWHTTNPNLPHPDLDIPPITRFCNRFLPKKPIRYQKSWVEQEKSLVERTDILQAALIGCGISNKMARRIAYKVILSNPKFDLYAEAYQHVLFVISQVRREFLLAIEQLRFDEGENAVEEWLCAIARGESYFCPSFVMDDL